MPDLEAFKAAQGRDPDATSAGSTTSLIVTDEPERVQEGNLQAYHGRGAGLWGMSTLATFVFWFGLALAGFFFAVHALIVQAIWSFVGTALFGPVPFFKTWQWYKRWLRGRPLSVAIDEELNRGAR